jgi:hypothetical protein
MDLFTDLAIARSEIPHVSTTIISPTRSSFFHQTHPELGTAGFEDLNQNERVKAW